MCQSLLTQLRNSLLTQLRKCCNHPFLFPGVEPHAEDTYPQQLIDGSGKFQLLVKNYPESGTMSKYLHSLPIGTMVPFKHIAFNIKIQYVVCQTHELSLMELVCMQASIS